MQHISGISREQIRFTSIEDFISTENPVRFIDSFVHALDLNKLGFSVQTLKKEGRPSFQSTVFLRLYLYAYLNGIRSCRKLEKESIRNLELQ